MLNHIPRKQKILFAMSVIVSLILGVDLLVQLSR